MTRGLLPVRRKGPRKSRSSRIRAKRASRVAKLGLHSMRVVSLSCGIPREVQWHGRTVTTGIYKQPVVGRVALRKLNLDGDGQADLSVHGGANKAVYCYPLEHYAYWMKELKRELPMGMFGENFTTE